MLQSLAEHPLILAPGPPAALPCAAWWPPSPTQPCWWKPCPCGTSTAQPTSSEPLSRCGQQQLLCSPPQSLLIPAGLPAALLPPGRAPCASVSLLPAPAACPSHYPCPARPHRSPAWCFALQNVVMRLPWVFAESWVWTLMVSGAARPLQLPVNSNHSWCTLITPELWAARLLRPQRRARSRPADDHVTSAPTPADLLLRGLCDQRPCTGFLGHHLWHR